MDLTKKDRVILINQYRILAALNPDESDHYKELISILEHGYNIFYSKVDEWISDDMPSSAGKFVLNVLGLYRAIEDFKRTYTGDSFSKEYFRFFRGFDGNNETEYLSFTRFLIETQGKFSEQRAYLKENDNLNSHMPTATKYKGMLNKWMAFNESYTLTEAQVLEILKADRDETHRDG
jgi:uncharacterized protein